MSYRRLTDYEITLLGEEIHAANVIAGWWAKFPNKFDRYSTAMMLVISELAEALEGDRKNLHDDHLPHHKMFDVELADAVIRILDLVGAYNVNIGYDYKDDNDEYIELVKADILNNNETIPESLYEITKIICSNYEVNYLYTRALYYIIAVAELKNIDLWNIVDEKRQYNKERADHKKEVRETENGKKY